MLVTDACSWRCAGVSTGIPRSAALPFSAFHRYFFFFFFYKLKVHGNPALSDDG